MTDELLSLCQLSHVINERKYGSIAFHIVVSGVPLRSIISLFLLSSYCRHSSSNPIRVMAPLKRSRSLNSDKALPLLPSVTSSPPSSGAETLSSSFVDAMNCRLSDCTTWSTPYVDKQTFKKLTQELVAPPTPSPSFKEREAYNCVDPIKPFSTGSNIRGVEMIDQYGSPQARALLKS